MESKIREIITEALGDKIKEYTPNHSLFMPSFMLDYSYFENGKGYEGGTCTETEHSFQIDLFYLNKNDFATDKKKLKKALIKNQLFDTLESFYDTTNKYYRATFQCVAIESEE